jgi:curli production assembly/transport component CsgG
MIKPTKQKLVILSVMILLSLQCFSQELTAIGEKPVTDSLSKPSIRAKNIIMIGAGSTLLNGNVNSPDYENFIQIQLKRFVSSNLNINGNLKKFDLKDYNFETNGFLSGDLNVEWYVFPYNKLTPYIYLGAGILTSNNFEDQNYKTQGGLGLDYLITNKIAITGSVEANYIYDEQKGSQLMQEADQLYFNALVGLHFYIGSKKSSSAQKVKQNQASVINSNPIEIN